MNRLFAAALAALALIAAAPASAVTIEKIVSPSGITALGWCASIRCR